MTALTCPDVTLIQVLTTIADVAIVAFLVYQVMTLFKGTQAVSLIKGLVILFAANALAGLLKLDALHWLLRQVTTMTFIGIPIVFQPEIRRGLEQLGRGRLFGTPMSAIGFEQTRRVLAEVCRAAETMSGEYMGSLIVLERETGVGDVAESGVKLDARVSGELLLTIFAVHTPLHDGAVVIRGNRMVAAACVLPLSERHASGRKVGTRHRAALGMSERSDAVVVVVSEETGALSMACDGELVRDLSSAELRRRLDALFDTGDKESKFRRMRGARR